MPGKAAIRLARKRMFGQISGADLEALHTTGSEKLLILDARSPSEFAAGHLSDAISVNSTDSFFSLFTDSTFANIGLVLCYCEFSNQRGPELAAYLRKYDFHINAGSLRFPRITILAGGFSQYHINHPGRCVGAYLRESDCGPDHSAGRVSMIAALDALFAPPPPPA
jgi:rhodanese-related sulfurtransferase